MNSQEFINKMSKYHKEVILKTFMTKYFIKGEEILRAAEWENLQIKFDNFMARSKEIREEMEPLIGKKDITSFKKYVELMDQDSKVYKKIDAVMKEMDKFNGVGE